MKILVKIGDVEISYEKAEEDSSVNAATCREGYSDRAVHSVLLDTISYMAKEANLLYESVSATEVIRGGIDD